MTLRSLPFLQIALWCGFMALLNSCALIGDAGKTDESGLGGVDGAFHNAFYKAQVAKLKGDREGAKEALLSCLDANPDEAVVHYELARLEREAEQWTAAHAAILEANSLDGNNPWYRTELADIALELGLYEEADDALEWVLQNKPEDERSARMLLNLRTAQGDLDGALRVVDVMEREWGLIPNGISTVTAVPVRVTSSRSRGPRAVGSGLSGCRRGHPATRAHSLRTRPRCGGGSGNPQRLGPDRQWPTAPRVGAHPDPPR